jgi:glycosyltransferase involved in cell wall biosynthesis
VNQLQRIAFVGNSLPRRCGIATFTTDLRKAVASLDPDIESCIVAMTDNGRAYDYPATVRLEIGDQSIEDYGYAADVLNDGRYDVVSLQHEFGIFGGEAGDHILTLLNRLSMPVVTTLHTVLSQPSRAQRAVIDRIVAVSSRLVVMAEKGRELLQKVYDVPAEKIEVIPHGIPDIAFAEPEEAKARFGFAGKAVILTFGLLSPNKGIEHVIDAMPAILRRRPDAFMSSSARRIPTSFARKGRLIARASSRAQPSSVLATTSFSWTRRRCSVSSRCATSTLPPT